MGMIKSEITMSLLRSSWQTGLSPFTLLADLLYPPTCAGCGVSVGSHRSLCPKCWSGICFIERPYCEVLGSPFSHDRASKFAAKLGVPCEAADIAQIAHRLSAVLTQVTSAGRVRRSGPFDGRKRLWEVAA